MLIGQPTPEQVIPLFNEFIRESVLVAHNAPFDLSFLRSEFDRLRMRLPHRHICTLEMSRIRFPRIRDHRIMTQRMLRREATSAFASGTRKISLISRHGASSLR